LIRYVPQCLRHLIDTSDLVVLYFLNYTFAMDVIESDRFKRWLKKLKDAKGKARILARIHRLVSGLAGDVEPVGGGISELRIHYGPGYRVYYYQEGEAFVILLCGGHKDSQQRDIETAHEVLKEWRSQR
jgi:putative addiction module killer protein